MIIYDKSDNLLLDIPVDDTSYRYRAIRQGDKVYLYFSLTEYVEMPIGIESLDAFLVGGGGGGVSLTGLKYGTGAAAFKAITITNQNYNY